MELFKNIELSICVLIDFEIMTSKMDENIPFHHWLDKDKRYLKECKTFRIALVYSDINARHGTSYVLDKVRKNGYEIISLFCCIIDMGFPYYNKITT